jgi:hypothetical protein
MPILRDLILAYGLVTTGLAVGAPFVVSDPLDDRATHCGWVKDGGARLDVPVTVTPAGKICKWDLAGFTAGAHTVNATAVLIDPVWGRLESAPSAPFAFSVPTAPKAPSGLALTP